MPAKDRSHYRGSYDTMAKRVREAANADPSTTCWRCGELARPGDPWQAGHIVDGTTAGGLAPEHRSCNTRAGALKLHRRREPRSPQWG